MPMTFETFQQQCRAAIARRAIGIDHTATFREADFGREWHATVRVGELEASVVAYSASLTPSAADDAAAMLVRAISEQRAEAVAQGPADRDDPAGRGRR